MMGDGGPMMLLDGNYDGKGEDKKQVKIIFCGMETMKMRAELERCACEIRNKVEDGL